MATNSVAREALSEGQDTSQSAGFLPQRHSLTPVMREQLAVQETQTWTADRTRASVGDLASWLFLLLTALSCCPLWTARGCGDEVSIGAAGGDTGDSALSLPLFCKSQLVQYTVRIERDPWTVLVSHLTLRWTAAQGTIPQGVQRQPLALWGHT